MSGGHLGRWQRRRRRSHRCCQGRGRQCRDVPTGGQSAVRCPSSWRTCAGGTSGLVTGLLSIPHTPSLARVAPPAGRRGIESGWRQRPAGRDSVARPPGGVDDSCTRRPSSAAGNRGRPARSLSAAWVGSGFSGVWRPARDLTERGQVLVAIAAGVRRRSSRPAAPLRQNLHPGPRRPSESMTAGHQWTAVAWY